MGDLVPRQQSDVITPVDRLRQELAEAVEERSIPRLQRVIGAATVAAEAQRRVARLAEGQSQPGELVNAARVGARQAAMVQIEATVAAGRILQEMADSGVRYDANSARPPARPGKPNAPTGRASNNRLKLEDLGISAIDSHRWQKLADIPDNVRVEYIDKMNEGDRDINVSGLLRFANPLTSPSEESVSVESAYTNATRLVSQLMRYDSNTLAVHAINTKRKAQFRKLVTQLREWADQTDIVLT